MAALRRFFSLGFIALIWVALCGGAAAWAVAASDAVSSAVIEVAGDWHWQTGDDQAWAEPGFDDTVWPTVPLPTSLDTLSLERTVWFRRSLELEGGLPAGDDLALAFTAASQGSYEVFAGGQALGSVQGPALGLPQPPTQIFSLPAAAVGSSGRVVLALRYEPAARFAPVATVASPPEPDTWKLGPRETLQNASELQHLRALRRGLAPVILAALLAALGLLELNVFLRRRGEPEHLWFGITALVTALNTFGDSYWVYELTTSLGLIRRLSEASVHMMTALFLQTLWLFFLRPMSSLLRAYQLSFVALVSFVLLAPNATWIFRTNTVRWSWQLPAMVAIAWLLTGELRRGNREARPLAVGGFVAMVAVGAELLWQVLGRGTLAPLASFALAFFVGSLELALANRFSRRFLESNELRQQLEMMVEDRTSELSKANERLRAENAERRAAEEAMRMLEQAVEQSSDGIAVSDMTGHLQFLNQAWARMHGYEVYDVLGHHMSLFHTSEQMQQQVGPFLAQVKEKGAVDGEIWHRRRDTTLFPTWTSSTLLIDPAGEAMGIVAIIRDITERRRADEEQLRLEARVQQSRKLESLAALASGIAHDYNNLLTSILGNAELALEVLGASSPATERIRQIEGVAERAAELTDRLLAFAGEDRLHLEQLDLNQLIEGMKSDLEAILAGRAVLELYLKEGLPPIEADRIQLRQILQHLVTNALEALEEDDSFICLRTGRRQLDASYLAGSVLPLTETGGTFVFLEVADPGRGMDETTQGRMFEPFFSTKQRERGLGLATVLGIVRAHRGGIKVYSAPHEGTTIEVLFPIASVQTLTRELGGQDLERWKTKGTLLVVDDEQIIRDVSRAILEPHGFSVLSACDGLEALELYRAHLGEIRAVLLDLTMPRMNGEETFRAIRELDPEARIILMSGYKQRESIRELTEKGLADFLAKPFRPAELVGKVHQALESRARPDDPPRTHRRKTAGNAP